MMRTDGCSKSGFGPGRFPRLYGVRCTIGTPAAASLAAPPVSGRATICATGPREGRRGCRIWRFSVVGTIARCTRRVTRSRVGPTGCSSSGGRTAGCCRTCQRLLRCPTMQSGHYGHATIRRAFDSTRARRAQVGSVSVWMSDGRSTSCIPERGPSRAFPRERPSAPPRTRRPSTAGLPRRPGGRERAGGPGRPRSPPRTSARRRRR